MSFKEEVKKTIKTRFVSGILVIVPLFAAIAVLRFIVETIDNFFMPYLVRLLGKEYGFPFVGVIVTLILIILAGILANNIIGRKLIKLWERAILRIPLFRTVYSASKQLVEGIAVPEKRTFEKVVLIEYPRKNVFALGFLVNRIRIRSKDCEHGLLSVFIPSTPTPFAGVAILLPESEVLMLDMSIEDGLKFVVSGSVSAPKAVWMATNSAFSKVLDSRSDSPIIKRETE
jgi:uncharacterized membrane protein